MLVTKMRLSCSLLVSCFLLQAAAASPLPRAHSLLTKRSLLEGVQPASASESEHIADATTSSSSLSPKSKSNIVKSQSHPVLQATLTGISMTLRSYAPSYVIAYPTAKLSSSEEQHVFMKDTYFEVVSPIDTSYAAACPPSASLLTPSSSHSSSSPSSTSSHMNLPSLVSIRCSSPTDGLTVSGERYLRIRRHYVECVEPQSATTSSTSSTTSTTPIKTNTNSNGNNAAFLFYQFQPALSETEPTTQHTSSFSGVGPCSGDADFYDNSDRFLTVGPAALDYRLMMVTRETMSLWWHKQDTQAAAFTALNLHALHNGTLLDDERYYELFPLAKPAAAVIKKSTAPAAAAADAAHVHVHVETASSTTTLLTDDEEEASLSDDSMGSSAIEKEEALVEETTKRHLHAGSSNTDKKDTASVTSSSSSSSSSSTLSSSSSVLIAGAVTSGSYSTLSVTLSGQSYHLHSSSLLDPHMHATSTSFTSSTPVQASAASHFIERVSSLPSTFSKQRKQEWDMLMKSLHTSNRDDEGSDAAPVLLRCWPPHTLAAARVDTPSTPHFYLRHDGLVSNNVYCAQLKDQSVTLSSTTTTTTAVATKRGDAKAKAVEEDEVDEDDTVVPLAHFMFQSGEPLNSAQGAFSIRGVGPFPPSATTPSIYQHYDFSDHYLFASAAAGTTATSSSHRAARFLTPKLATLELETTHAETANAASFVWEEVEAASLKPGGPLFVTEKATTTTMRKKAHSPSPPHHHHHPHHKAVGTKPHTTPKPHNTPKSSASSSHVHPPHHPRDKPHTSIVAPPAPLVIDVPRSVLETKAAWWLFGGGSGDDDKKSSASSETDSSSSSSAAAAPPIDNAEQRVGYPVLQATVEGDKYYVLADRSFLPSLSSSTSSSSSSSSSSSRSHHYTLSSNPHLITRSTLDAHTFHFVPPIASFEFLDHEVACSITCTPLGMTVSDTGHYYYLRRHEDHPMSQFVTCSPANEVEEEADKVNFIWFADDAVNTKMKDGLTLRGVGPLANGYDMSTRMLTVVLPSITTTKHAAPLSPTHSLSQISALDASTSITWLPQHTQEQHTQRMLLQRSSSSSSLPSSLSSSFSSSFSLSNTASSTTETEAETETARSNVVSVAAVVPPLPPAPFGSAFVRLLTSSAVLQLTHPHAHEQADHAGSFFRKLIPRSSTLQPHYTSLPLLQLSLSAALNNNNNKNSKKTDLALHTVAVGEEAEQEGKSEAVMKSKSVVRVVGSPITTIDRKTYLTFSMQVTAPVYLPQYYDEGDKLSKQGRRLVSIQCVPTADFIASSSSSYYLRHDSHTFRISCESLLDWKTTHSSKKAAAAASSSKASDDHRDELNFLFVQQASLESDGHLLVSSSSSSSSSSPSYSFSGVGPLLDSDGYDTSTRFIVLASSSSSSSSSLSKSEHEGELVFVTHSTLATMTNGVERASFQVRTVYMNADRTKSKDEDEEEEDTNDKKKQPLLVTATESPWTAQHNFAAKLLQLQERVKLDQQLHHQHQSLQHQ